MHSTNRISRERVLPDAVQRYLTRACGDLTDLPHHQRIKQIGEMRFSPTSRWHRFKAEESIDLVHPVFSCRARFRMTPLVWLDAADKCTGTDGSFRAQLWGHIPVLQSHGDAVLIGQVGRYLAELPWAPYAMLTNTALRWREITDDRVEVSLSVASMRIAVRFGFDRDGNIETAYMPERFRFVNGKAFPTPWRGIFGGHENIHGMWVPAYAEAAWELADGNFNYWRGMITSIEHDG
jgi:hypothetical protein